jgi:hypothetical protein
MAIHEIQCFGDFDHEVFQLIDIALDFVDERFVEHLN